MSDSVEGLVDVPREFVKEGVQFMNKCQKRKLSPRVKPIIAFFSSQVKAALNKS